MADRPAEVGGRKSASSWQAWRPLASRVQVVSRLPENHLRTREALPTTCQLLVIAIQRCQLLVNQWSGD